MSGTSFSLAELAQRFGLEARGDADFRVEGVGSLRGALGHQIGFLANPRYRRELDETRAGAVILREADAAHWQGRALIAKDPYATYARIAALLHPAPTAVPGKHPSAVVDATAVIDPTASIGPLAVIGARARIGARSTVGPGCVLLEDVTLGTDTRLVASVTLCSSVVIGDRCLVHPGVVIGGDGFGFANEKGAWVKVPQIGSVRIGNDVDVGASTTIDRGAIEDTVIGDGVKLDNQIQIAHNVRIGAHTVIAGCTGISGSATIGQRCMIGGMVGIAGHLSICDDVVVTGKSFVSGSIRKPGYYSSGLPIDETPRFRKNAARFGQLDDMARDLRRLRGSADPSAADAADEAGDEEP